MIGYKAAIVRTTRVVITLEIPEDAITNVDRKSVAVKESAKYRTNKAKVIKIEDENAKEYTEAITGFYNYKSLTYKLNEIIEISDYDTDLEKVCSSGIHFFLTKHIAELYGISSLQNGLYQSWHENGQKRKECMYVNRKQEGLNQGWHENGEKKFECIYVNGKLDGLYQEWYSNGQKYKEYNYVNGVKEGLHQLWYDNGQKYNEFTYVNGKIEGLYQEWFKNGQKNIECTYINENVEGLYQQWDATGEKKIEYNCMNGKIIR